MRVAAVLLVALAVSKVLDSTNENRYFQEPDPLLTFLSNRQLMLLAAMFEVGVATYLWLSRTLSSRGWALLYFCGAAAAYKIGSLFIYNLKPCTCLGIVGRTLHLSTGELEFYTWALLALFGATGLLALYHSRTGNMDRWEDEAGGAQATKV
jgi:hypothetical protein